MPPIVDHALSAHCRSTPWQLTPREKHVLAAVCQGLTNAAIAAELAISERTAQAYVARLLSKSGATNRTTLAVCALRHGVVALHPCRCGLARPAGDEPIRVRVPR
jgi:DNA-binding NarL/FixJ family response regulator